MPKGVDAASTGAERTVPVVSRRGAVPAAKSSPTDVANAEYRSIVQTVSPLTPTYSCPTTRDPPMRKVGNVTSLP